MKEIFAYGKQCNKYKKKKKKKLEQKKRLIAVFDASTYASER